MIRVFVLDDHDIVRQGLVNLINECENLEVVGDSGHGTEALNIIDEMADKPHVVLTDIQMPYMDGIEFTKTLINKYKSDIKVIALTMVKQSSYIKQIFKVGAIGYILKNCDKKELQRAIEMVSEGQVYYSPEVSSSVMKDLAGVKSDVVDLITDREKEVLKLIVQDMSNKQIADKLHISVRTVETHKQNLISKTGVNSVAGLTVYAIKNHLVDDL